MVVFASIGHSQSSDDRSRGSYLPGGTIAQSPLMCFHDFFGFHREACPAIWRNVGNLGNWGQRHVQYVSTKKIGSAQRSR